MDTLTRFDSHSLSNSYLTKEEIKSRCPVAFTQIPTRSAVSDKYVLMSSEQVIDDLEKLGWKVVEAKQRKPSRKLAEKGKVSQFSYHQIWFQNPDISITRTDKDGQEVIDCYPRIVLQNSADGLSRLKFGCGLYRLVCSNGLVISDLKLAEFSVQHINYTFEYVKKLIQEIVAELPRQVEQINEMQHVQLSFEQKLDFAKEALKIRKGLKEEDDLKVDEETLTDMLTPVRDEDKGDDLWKVYNVLQEKVVKGGFSVAKDEKSRARKVREVKSFISSFRMSRDLDSIARNYLPVKEVEPVAA